MGANGGPDTSDWRAQIAGDNTEALKFLARSKSPADFMARVLEQNAALSKRQEPLKLTETSTADEVSAYRKALDVPDVPKEAKDEAYADAYGLKLPESAGVPQALIGAFARKMNSAHVPKATVQKVVGEFATIQTAIAQQAERTDAEKAKAWTSSLRDEMGSKEYDARKDAASTWLSAEFKDKADDLQELLGARLPSGGLLGDHPFFFNLIAEKAMGAGLTDRIERNSIESNGKSLAQQQAEIEALRRTDRAAYNRPETQDKLKRVIELRQKAGEIDSWGNEVRRRA